MNLKLRKILFVAKTNIFLNFDFRFPKQLKKNAKMEYTLWNFLFYYFLFLIKLNNKRNEIYFIAFSIFSIFS